MHGPTAYAKRGVRKVAYREVNGQLRHILRLIGL
jgi:hypothetical protein